MPPNYNWDVQVDEKLLYICRHTSSYKESENFLQIFYKSVSKLGMDFSIYNSITISLQSTVHTCEH